MLLVLLYSMALGPLFDEEELRRARRYLGRWRHDADLLRILDPPRLGGPDGRRIGRDADQQSTSRLIVAGDFILECHPILLQQA